jgi:hypothetical protein
MNKPKPLKSKYDLPEETLEHLMIVIGISLENANDCVEDKEYAKAKKIWKECHKYTEDYIDFVVEKEMDKEYVDNDILSDAEMIND